MAEPVTVSCCRCGVEFCMPSTLNEQLRRTREFFYCPNGHGQRYIGKTDEQRRIEELERDVRRLELDRDGWRREAQRWRCPFAGCWVDVSTKAALASHLVREHGANKVPARELRALAADAGPDCYGSGA